jgi:hypothetical protein
MGFQADFDIDGPNRKREVVAENRVLKIARQIRRVVGDLGTERHRGPIDKTEGARIFRHQRWV